MIPRDAIISSIKDPSVFVVKDEIVSLVPIFTGRNYDSYIEVVSGLTEGEQVIINGQINLTNGTKVSIVK
jgi:multidrug efflux pump subunit AcrA (membrane-fusion protein)